MNKMLRTFAPRTFMEGKHCLVYCGDEVCDCSCSPYYKSREDLKIMAERMMRTLQVWYVTVEFNDKEGIRRAFELIISGDADMATVAKEVTSRLARVPGLTFYVTGISQMSKVTQETGTVFEKTWKDHLAEALVATWQSSVKAPPTLRSGQGVEVSGF